jgi:segregation and condensation protein A
MQEIIEGRNEDYSFKLEQFEGPLDMLLDMLHRAKLSIKDIFISDITEQYLAYIGTMQRLDIDKASSFAAYAARLLDIKVRSILPKDEEAVVQLEEDKSTIVYELEMREVMNSAAVELQGHETRNKFYWEPEYTEEDCRYLITNFNIDLLMEAFAQILHKADLRAQQAPVVKIIPKDKFTVLDKTKELIILFKDKKRILFHELFEEEFTRGEKISTFLALLELVKRQYVVVIQKDVLEDINIEIKEGADEMNFEEVFNGQFEQYN